MLLYFRARPKDFGAVFVRLSSGNLGSITANTTNTFGLGGISDKDTAAPNTDHTAYIDQVTVGCVTVPADADGTYLLNVVKYDASAATTVTIVSGFDMEALVAGKTENATIVTSLTDQQRMMDYGDFLYLELVSNSAAIDTQMVGGQVGVLLKYIT